MPSTHVIQAGGWRKLCEPADSALGDMRGDASGHDCWVNVSSHRAQRLCSIVSKASNGAKTTNRLVKAHSRCD